MLEKLKVSYNGIHKDLATTWLLYHRAIFFSKPPSQKAPLRDAEGNVAVSARCWPRTHLASTLRRPIDDRHPRQSSHSRLLRQAEPAGARARIEAGVAKCQKARASRCAQPAPSISLWTRNEKGGHTEFQNIGGSPSI